ncbi:hypothetical protein OBBRIDRAFT_792860 [Obba rivulosa]|uniref:Uncharacterized protein n=1 Tax=Obba rivulosa TaxID=1052685 RepID=A0A8E2DKU8_9APHY|nr:hypothetical protein OBBRIDRAFT_792860 [Obba rivulosa]
MHESSEETNSCLQRFTNDHTCQNGTRTPSCHCDVTRGCHGRARVGQRLVPRQVSRVKVNHSTLVFDSDSQMASVQRGEMLAPSVEESRAKRLERQQSRFRDRGGVFVPSEHNALLDILLAKGPACESPAKTSRHADEGADQPSDVEESSNTKTAGNSRAPQARRKSKAVQEIERAQAGPSDAGTAPKETKKARASRAGTAKAPITIDKDEDPPAPARKVASKPAKKAGTRAKVKADQEPADPPEPKTKKAAPARKRARKVADESDGESDFEQKRRKRAKTAPAKRGRGTKAGKTEEDGHEELEEMPVKRPGARGRGKTKAARGEEGERDVASDDAAPVKGTAGKLKGKAAPARKAAKETVPEPDDDPLQGSAPTRQTGSTKTARTRKGKAQLHTVDDTREARTETSSNRTALHSVLEEPGETGVPAKPKPTRRKLQLPQSDDDDDNDGVVRKVTKAAQRTTTAKNTNLRVAAQTKVAVDSDPALENTRAANSAQTSNSGRQVVQSDEEETEEAENTWATKPQTKKVARGHQEAGSSRKNGAESRGKPQATTKPFKATKSHSQHTAEDLDAHPHATPLSDSGRPEDGGKTAPSRKRVREMQSTPAAEPDSVDTAADPPSKRPRTTKSAADKLRVQDSNAAAKSAACTEPGAKGAKAKGSKSVPSRAVAASRTTRSRACVSDRVDVPGECSADSRAERIKRTARKPGARLRRRARGGARPSTSPSPR